MTGRSQLSEFDDSVFTPEIIEENDLDTDVLGDGIDTADDSDGSSTVDLNTIDTLASPVLSAAPLNVAAGNGEHVITAVGDYAADEEVITGCFRDILWNDPYEWGDTYIFADELFDDENKCHIYLKRNLSTSPYFRYIVGGDVTNGRHVVFHPDPNYENVRFALTLNNAARVDAQYTCCDWEGWNYNGESSTVRSALFAFYWGELTFTNCGFYNNTGVGTRGAVVLLNGAYDPECFPRADFFNCIGYNNTAAGTGTTAAAVVSNQNSTLGVLNFQGCTFGNQNGVRDIYSATKILDLDNDLIRNYRDTTGTHTDDFSAEVADYSNNDFRLLYTSARAVSNTRFRYGYDGGVIRIGGPVGALSELYIPKSSYLTKVFGDDETILKALAGLDVPFLSKTEADNYFGEAPI